MALSSASKFKLHINETSLHLSSEEQKNFPNCFFSPDEDEELEEEEIQQKNNKENMKKNVKQKKLKNNKGSTSKEKNNTTQSATSKAMNNDLHDDIISMQQQCSDNNNDQSQLTEGPLLNAKGELQQAGYSTSLVRRYARSGVVAPWHRIKEWDYYYVGDANFGIALTVADLSYSALVSVTILDFKNKREMSKVFTRLLSMGKMGLPETSAEGDILVQGKQYMLNLKTHDGRRQLTAKITNFSEDGDLECQIELTQQTKHSMVISTPFPNSRNYFYYNQKINLLRGKGFFRIGKMEYQFGSHDKKEQMACFGVLDWGRGVWTYVNTWFWASMSAHYQGHLIGFNLGYGFGDTSKATQNMFYYDQQAHKLNDVQFQIPKNSKDQDRYLQIWKLTSKNRDIDLTFQPLIDRSATLNYLLVKSEQHQVFGYFSGTFTIKGKVYRFENLIGFAEKVYNRW